MCSCEGFCIGVCFDLILYGCFVSMLIVLQSTSVSLLTNFFYCCLLLFTTILSFNICLWGATIVHDKTPTFTFLLHNWIRKLCLKIKNKSCPDKELVSVPRELLVLIHLKNNINSFSSKSSIWNKEKNNQVEF